MYDDLLRNEIHLHLVVDGSDQVGTREFGAVLTMRSTAAIGRELGGFSQYLQNNVYSYIGGKYQPINFRDRMQKSIEQAFHEDLELIHIGFFDSMNPSNPIQVEGKKGWEEKPLCYLILKAKDPSVDRLPMIAGIAMVGVLLPALVWIYRRGKTKSSNPEDAGLRLPNEITPFSAVITLQRFLKQYASNLTLDDRGRLQADISELENRFFAADAKTDSHFAKEALH